MKKLGHILSAPFYAVIVIGVATLKIWDWERPLSELSNSIGGNSGLLRLTISVECWAMAAYGSSYLLVGGHPSAAVYVWRFGSLATGAAFAVIAFVIDRNRILRQENLG